MHKDEFWILWNENNSHPTKKHPTAHLARSEAERLARQHPGQRFHVLRWEGTCRMADIHWDILVGKPEFNE